MIDVVANAISRDVKLQEIYEKLRKEQTLRPTEEQARRKDAANTDTQEQDTPHENSLERTLDDDMDAPSSDTEARPGHTHSEVTTVKSKTSSSHEAYSQAMSLSSRDRDTEPRQNRTVGGSMRVDFAGALHSNERMHA